MQIRAIKGFWVPIGLFVGMTTFAYAQDGIRQLPSAGKWSVTPEIGTSFNLDGGFVDPASISLGANPVVGEVCTENNSCFLGFSVQAAFDATVYSSDFSDVYDPDIGLAISFNYGLSDDSEVFGRFGYTSYSANSFVIATAETAGELNVQGIGSYPFAAGTDFIAEMSDYEEYSLTVGYRRFFMGGNGFHPFASAEAGVAQIPGIDMKLSTSSGSIGTTGFYDDSTVFTGGLGAGFRYDVAENTAIGVEGLIRYIDKLTSSSDIRGSENNGDSRLDLAVYFGLTWQF